MGLKKISILLIFAGMASVLLAQTDKTQSVSFSLSLFPKEYSSPYLHNKNDFWGKEYEALIGNYGYKAVGYDKRSLGTWELSYRKYLSEKTRLNVSAVCGLSSKHWDLYDVADGPRAKDILDYRFSLLPGIDYVYLQRPQTRFYLTGQTGVDWVHRGLAWFDKDRDKHFFAWQLWWNVEFNVSPSLVANMSFGYGTLGIAKIGISYPF